MSFKQEDIKKLADLAKLELTSSEIKNYQNQLGQILHYVDKIGELKLDNIKESISGVGQGVAGPRPDQSVASEPATIKQASELQNNYVVSPEVFER